MPRSMTGFARSEGVCGGFRLIWRLRSVNHRYLALSWHKPENWPGYWHDLEMQASKRIRGHFNRGHFDCELHLVAESDTEQGLELNKNLLTAILNLEEEVRQRAAPLRDSSLSMDRLLSWPDLVQSYQPSQDQSQLFQQTALELLEAAAHNLTESRNSEGAALASVITQLLGEFNQLLEKVTDLLPTIRQAQTERLHSRINQLTETATDQNALARELAILLNRTDISEEMERLKIHLNEVQTALSKSEPLGRRLDFFCQELNRETNTICAKSQDGELTQIGVEMKLIVEKLREQAQNLE